jgi:hypothetical protein
MALRTGDSSQFSTSFAFLTGVGLAPSGGEEGPSPRTGGEEGPEDSERRWGWGGEEDKSERDRSSCDDVSQVN